MTTGKILDLPLKTAPVFAPLLKAARYKGAYGGRGSGKSHFFAEMIVERCVMERGLSVVCIRELQQSLKASSKRLIEGKIQQHGLGKHFDVLHDRIKTPGNGLIIFQGMQDHTAESIKSLEGFNIAWIEEAQALSERSLALLRPTIRALNSEIWASWNPTRNTDAIDVFLRQKAPTGAIIVKANWRDNPWWTPTLEEERRNDFERYPDRYMHTWEGEYAGAFEGAYFAQGLSLAKQQKRIGHVGADPLLPVRGFFDLGGAGAKADAMAIWIVQFVNREIRVLDYIEGVGQALGYYAAELRRKGYERVICHLPHDGANTNGVTGKRYVEHLEDAGFTCADPVPNQGAGAAMMRIEAVRRILPRCWFNEATTEPGRLALGFYHERRDSQRNIGLGPEHDWASHAADAFGLMAIVYEEPRGPDNERKRRLNSYEGSTSWAA